MADFDLILRDAPLVHHDRVEQSDIGILDGIISAVGKSLGGSASAELHASGLHAFPGVIDSHVHFNEPGRTDWEGIGTGSRAVAAGGGTCYFDMPLNSNPPVLDADTFNAKRKAAESQSVTDFAIWGGLTPLNLPRLEELHACGVIGFKAFMSNSGIGEFPRVDEGVLREGMKRVADLGSIVAVHAESEAITARLTQEASGNSARDYLGSRPIAAECEAIDMALQLAKETGCRLHVVHVSSAAGVALVSAAKREGIDVSCETCPHYLILNGDDLIRLGAVAKCAPPLRNEIERQLLVKATLSGAIDTLGSDHSPAPPSMKSGHDFFKIWGGISGAQHLLSLALDLWSRTSSDRWPLLARLLSGNVARRFSLPNMGTLAVGADANITLVNFSEQDTVELARLHYRHAQTPYAGMRLKGKVVRTLLRGQTIAEDGQYSGRAPAGRLIKPTHR